jgi:glycosyltransferase involved in cell wall biosynthesis
MSTATPLSAVIIAKDEEERIVSAIESVSFCDEVLVLDGGSTDRTRERAERAGARVLQNEPWPGYVAQRNRASDHARHDWVLAVDADERVTPALRDEIQALRRSGFTHAGYRIPRVAHYMGRFVRATDWYPDPQLRLYDRRRGRWQGHLVHESVKVDGSVGRLRHELEHYTYRDVSHHMQTIDRYTTLWAEQAFAQGQRAGMVTAFFAAGFAFFRNYVLRRGLLLGAVGLTISTMNAYYTYAKLAKLIERARTTPSG